jgi:hypothetical protein
MKIAPLLAAAAISLSAVAGCQRDATVPVDDADRGTTAGPATRAAAVIDGWQSYGEPISAELPVADVADVLAEPAAFAGRDVQLRGTISEVCAKKGCWLRIADPSGGEETVFVKFTCPIEADARLIPENAAGKPVVVQGQVVVEEMSQEQARHYAEDAGKSAEEVAAIVGPQKTIRVESPAAKVGA